MANFKELLIQQIEQISHCEIEENTPNYLRVWNSEEQKYFTYLFTDSGDLREMY